MAFTLAIELSNSIPVFIGIATVAIRATLETALCLKFSLFSIVCCIFNFVKFIFFIA